MLGIVLSMELIGMAIGSVLLGGIADRIGRRPTITGCLVVMAAGMFGASTAPDIMMLSVWRVLTGLGIGGMLTATNAAVAEASNGARRSFCVTIMAAGYPVGAIATLCFIPLVLWRVPESIAFPAQRRGRRPWRQSTRR